MKTRGKLGMDAVLDTAFFSLVTITVFHDFAFSDYKHLLLKYERLPKPSLKCSDKALLLFPVDLNNSVTVDCYQQTFLL